MSYDPSNAHAAMLLATMCCDDVDTAVRFFAGSNEYQARVVAEAVKFAAPADADVATQVDQACAVLIDFVWRGAMMLRERAKSDQYKLGYRRH